MEKKAYAKINWDLHVLGRRLDGYHALDTVMVNVSLHDTLQFEPADELQFTCSDPALPTDEGNLVVKAARLLASASGHSCGARIHLSKHIPAGGGMGGGSSDGACTLVGLNELWKLDWPKAELHQLAAQLGSDVSFFLYGGWQRCLGRGEIVEAIPGSERFPPLTVLLVLPNVHVATPAVYKKLKVSDVGPKTRGRGLTDVSRVIQLAVTKLRQSTIPVELNLSNSLNSAACEVEPRLRALQEVLHTVYPGQWLMSGSGGVHFVVTREGDDGARLKTALAALSDLRTEILPVQTTVP